MTTIVNKYGWNTGPTAYITIAYEHKRSGTSMFYRFNWRVWLAYEDAWYNNALSLRFSFDQGAYNYTETVKGYATNSYGWDKSGTTAWMEVKEKYFGETKCAITLYDDSTKYVKSTHSASLTVITMASAIGSVADFEVDDGVNIVINKYSNVANDTLTITYSGQTIKTIANAQSGKITFTDAEKQVIYNLLKTRKDDLFTFELDSAYDGTYSSHSEAIAKGTITDALPTFDAKELTYYDGDSYTSQITQNNLIILQSHSNLCVWLPSAQGAKGATISKYDIVCGNASAMVTSANREIYLGYISVSGNVDLIVTVTDSRGYTTTATKSIYVTEYKEPTIDAKLSRENNYESKTYFEVNASYTEIGSNSVHISYQYCIIGEAYNTDKDINNNQRHELVCDQKYAYSFRVTAYDDFDVVSTKEFVLSKGKMPLFIDIEKNAVGMNAFPLSGEALRVGGGVAVFEDCIVLRSPNKYFKITIDDSGKLSATEY